MQVNTYFLTKKMHSNSFLVSIVEKMAECVLLVPGTIYFSEQQVSRILGGNATKDTIGTFSYRNQKNQLKVSRPGGNPTEYRMSTSGPF